MFRNHALRIAEILRKPCGDKRLKEARGRLVWVALVCASRTACSFAEDTIPGASPPGFLGAQSCSSSSCHGGAGNHRDQYTIWSNHDYHHVRPFATLETARAERIATVLKVGNPARSQSCTVCHAPFQTVPPGRLVNAVEPAEGVSCENCHGPAENWLRGHTRSDWSHEDRVHAGMRNLRNLYVRANTCVACHQNLDSGIQQAGHPELIFELDGQAVSQPKHWRQTEDKPGPQIWLVGQAVALREMSWQLSHEKSPNQNLAARWEALLWLLRLAGKMESHLPEVEISSFEPSAELLDQIHRWSDRFAKEAANLRWSGGLTRKCVALLADTGETFRDEKISLQVHARRAERLVLALDRLITGLGEGAVTPRLSQALDGLFNRAQSLPDFNPDQFAERLKELHANVSRTLDSK